MKEARHILSISGEGQNVGKTLLATAIVAKFSRTHDLYGLKITPHFHKDTGEAREIVRQGEIVLFEEQGTHTRKDTERMLAAGASRAFLLQASDTDLSDALALFFAHAGTNTPVICESGAIALYVKTGVHLHVRQLNCQLCAVDKMDNARVADRIVTYTTTGFDFDLNELRLEGNRWKLKL